MTLDPRLTPARPDLAAKDLEGQVEAARFVEGTVREVIEPQAPVRRAPAPDASLDTEALMGERVTVYETTTKAGPGASCTRTAMSAGCRRPPWAPAGAAPTHRVAALRTLRVPGSRHQAAAADAPCRSGRVSPSSATRRVSR